jgi:hypothetical protein
MGSNRIGDQPIQPEAIEAMNRLGRLIDDGLNGKGSLLKADPEWGFILMVFPFDDDPKSRCNYISNAQRQDVVTILREQLRRFGGAPDVVGTA